MEFSRRFDSDIGATQVCQFLLGIFIAIVIFAGIHEFGHWVVYEKIGSEPCFQWLIVNPTGYLSAEEHVIALHAGLLAHVLPGIAACFYLLAVNPKSRVALVVLFISWVPRSLFILVTLPIDGSGDEAQIQRFFLSDRFIGDVWVWLLSVAPASAYLLFWAKRGKPVIKKELFNSLGYGSFAGIMVAVGFFVAAGNFEIFGAC